MSRPRIQPSPCIATAASQEPAMEATGEVFMNGQFSGLARRKDWFFRVQSRRDARFEELGGLILEGVASEAERFEYEELRQAIALERPAQTIEEWKR